MTSQMSCCALKAQDEEERHYYSLGIIISWLPDFTDLCVSAELETSARMVGSVLSSPQLETWQGWSRNSPPRCPRISAPWKNPVSQEVSAFLTCQPYPLQWKTAQEKKKYDFDMLTSHNGRLWENGNHFVWCFLFREGKIQLASWQE